MEWRVRASCVAALVCLGLPGMRRPLRGQLPPGRSHPRAGQRSAPASHADLIRPLLAGARFRRSAPLELR